MNAVNDKKDKSFFKIITVLIPIIISVLSFGFGVYQYFDKRFIEKELNELKTKETLVKNQADIYIQYLETDLESIHTYTAHGSSFDEACLKWLRHLEATPVFGVKLELVENLIYKEIKDFRGNIKDHYITFFLINNTGANKATNISTTFYRRKNDEVEDFPIKLDLIESGKGVMFAIDHFNVKTNKYYSSRLDPKDGSIEYFDVFLGEKKKIKIRPKLNSPKLVSPKVRLLF